MGRNPGHSVQGTSTHLPFFSEARYVPPDLIFVPGGKPMEYLHGKLQAFREVHLIQLTTGWLGAFRERGRNRNFFRCVVGEGVLKSVQDAADYLRKLWLLIQDHQHLSVVASNLHASRGIYPSASLVPYTTAAASVQHTSARNERQA